MPQYDATTLARSGVVVVSLGYRLGFEGFGHLPGVPDNRGLLDQLTALEWVRRNIAEFGGDPGNVTVFGQSAGAASIAYLAGAPAAEGLFRRAILQSVPAGHRDAAEDGAVTATVAAAAGVPATVDGMAALPPEAILAVQDAPLTGRDAGLTAFGPVVDGDLVTGPPWAVAGREDTDLICGFTHDEFEGLGGPAPPGAALEAVAASFGLGGDAYRRAYPGRTDTGLVSVLLSDALMRMPSIRVAEAHARRGGRTWMYDFAWRSPAAGHGIDVPFVFGNGDGRYAARFLGSPPHPGFGPLSERMRAAWTGFAATGDPGWPTFDLDRRRTRIWDTPPTDADDPIAASRRLWAELTCGDGNNG
ncbi:carboxylesterase family protein [Actinomadura sp. DC4]|uniref:carboxylesterase family protein n=1 Tax=Actinomadura sp. DC4 TaxID=3055069 RepID=UPI0025B08F83|nr:carboxylesterase family protein [Actinomadura sp. DC4]MDN3354348.1 carboxylesterase family protein [Actinomadura sp. DC4]